MMNPNETEYLSSLKGSKKFGPQVVCHRDFEPREAKFSSNFPPLNNSLLVSLEKSGITKLYSHQHQAICSILEGKDILVATPTASGKSMIYNLPVLNDLLSGDPGHALYIFPDRSFYDIFSSRHYRKREFQNDRCWDRFLWC